MPACLACHVRLLPADKDHRYCPRCGASRVIADPPASSDPTGAYLTVGWDVIGPRSGRIYGYPRRQDLPAEWDPLKGPSTDTEEEWRDLFAASGSPLPEQAWNVYRVPGWASEEAPRGDVSLYAPLARVAARQTRLFVLTQNDKLLSLDSRTHQYTHGWLDPLWPSGQLRSDLRVSESLVYATFLTQGQIQLKAVEIGRGATLIDLALDFEEPEVLIAGGEILILSQVAQHRQCVTRYRLADFATTPAPSPVAQHEFPIQRVLEARPPRPIRLGGDFIFGTANGQVYRWGRDEAEPEKVWPNVMDARLISDAIPLGKDEVGYLADAGAIVHLLRFSLVGSGRVELGEPLALPVLVQSRTRRVAAAGGVLYVLADGPGSPLTLYSTGLADPRSGGHALSPVHAFAGSQGAAEAELLAVPWQNEAHLLVHYIASEYERAVYLVNPRTPAVRELARPSRQEDIRILWETGRVWLVDMQQGKISRFT